MRISRRQDEVQRRFLDGREQFEKSVGTRIPSTTLAAFKVTAVPVGSPLQLDRVFHNREVSRGFHDVNGTWRHGAANSSKQIFGSPVDLSERPILGGAAWVSPSTSSGRWGKKLIMRDGVVDLWFKWPWYESRNSAAKSMLLFEWLIAASANVIASANAFREAVQAPSCEYGLTLDMLSTNGAAETPVQIASTRLGSAEPFHCRDRNACNFRPL